VPHDESDYSDYIKHLSNLGGGLLFISGFMFTVITILLTQLPNLNSPQSQLNSFLFLGNIQPCYIFSLFYYDRGNLLLQTSPTLIQASRRY